MLEFLSTLSLRRATPIIVHDVNSVNISIHALLAESDGHTHYMGVYEQISIHALLAESDSQGDLFQYQDTDFYPRSPCGERPIRWMSTGSRDIISIHALLAESDYFRGPAV